MFSSRSFAYSAEQARRIERALKSVNHNVDTEQAIREFTSTLAEFQQEHSTFGFETWTMCQAKSIARASGVLAYETESLHWSDKSDKPDEIFVREAKALNPEASKRDIENRIRDVAEIWEMVNDLNHSMLAVERAAAKRMWTSSDANDISLIRLFRSLTDAWHRITGRWPELISLHGPEQDWPSGYCLRLGKRLGNPFALLLDRTGLLATTYDDDGLDDDALDYMLTRARREARRAIKDKT